MIRYKNNAFMSPAQMRTTRALLSSHHHLPPDEQQLLSRSPRLHHFFFIPATYVIVTVRTAIQYQLPGIKVSSRDDEWSRGPGAGDRKWWQ